MRRLQYKLGLRQLDRPQDTTDGLETQLDAPEQGDAPFFSGSWVFPCLGAMVARDDHTEFIAWLPADFWLNTDL